MHLILCTIPFLAPAAVSPVEISSDCVINQKRLAEKINNLRAVVRLDSADDPHSWYVHHFRAYLDSFVLYQTAMDPSKIPLPHSQRLFINNSRYYAKAAARKTDDHFVLLSVQPSDHRALLRLKVRNALLFPVILNNRLLTEWFSDPKCQVKRAVYEHYNGQDVYVIILQYDTDPAAIIQRGNLPEVDELPFSAEIVLNPGKSWRIERVTQTIVAHFPHNVPANTLEYHMSAEYTHSLRGEQMPSIVRERERLVGVNGREATRVWHIESVAPCDAEDEHFRLSYYGLPEPPGVTWERPTPWWLYSLFAALVLVLVCGVVYAVAVRSQRKPAGS